MSGLNRVILMGRLGQDPEMKDAKGVAIANFSVATSKSWKDDSGEKKEKTTWHNVVCFRKTAELAGKYLSKGRQVLIEGELQTRSWEDDAGVKKYKTEVIAHNLQFISDGKNQTTAGEAGQPEPDAPTFENNEEIPF